MPWRVASWPVVGILPEPMPRALMTLMTALARPSLALAMSLAWALVTYYDDGRPALPGRRPDLQAQGQRGRRCGRFRGGESGLPG